MKLTINFDEQKIFDLVNSANIGYWAEKFERNGLKMRVKDAFGPKWHTLNFRRAIELCANEFGWVLDPGRCDAGTGDAFIQLAAFGEIKYG